jgi:predicted nucleic acid-binding protein
VDDRRYFVDANVPMYAVGADHPLKQPCLRILQAVAMGDLVALTDAEVHQEILHRYAGAGDRARAIEVAELFLRAVPDVLPVTGADIYAAMGFLRSHAGLPVRDAVHLAVMTRHGVRLILSADQHFDAVPDVERVDPLDWG